MAGLIDEAAIDYLRNLSFCPQTARKTVEDLK
jgi:hypothetical protein